LVREHPSVGRGRAENANPVSEGECVAQDSRIAVTDEKQVPDEKYHLCAKIVSGAVSAG
jgi:hypothetical protein